MKRQPPWSLPDLCKTDRNALTVYAALRWLARNKNRLGTSRARIREQVLLSEKRITSAIQALAKARWITLRYGRAKNRIWYRLTFRAGDFFPVGLKTTLSKSRCRGKNDPQQTVCCGAQNGPYSRKGVGDGPAQVCGDPAPAAQEHLAMTVEREQMAMIRRRRGAATGQKPND